MTNNTTNNTANNTPDYLTVLTDLPRDNQLAERLRTAWIATGQDPVLHELAQARQRIEQAQQDIRTLIALAREFTRPRPYRLTDLADAAGMSTYAVRTAYGPREITQLIAILGQTTHTPQFLTGPIAVLAPDGEQGESYGPQPPG
jgi:hypothetical protein